jgi:uncharacterized protein (TIGR02677 family)
VAAALAKLREWGNLRADPDTSRVTTVEEFNRARYLYQLTPEGEAAEEALAAYDAALGRRGELQAVALDDIRTLLRALDAAVHDADPAKIHSLLRELVHVFEGLAGNAQAFMSSLQRTIDLHEADLDAFLAYKERLVGYIERFIGDLVVATGDIAELLRRLDPYLGTLLDLAAERAAADVLVDEHGTDEDARAAWRAEWTDRWAGLRQWFIGAGGHPAQAALLRSRARQAITGLLGLVATINERRAGRSDRSADFRALARWFAEAPTDSDAHRLWRAAFGLSPARHLTVDAATLDARADEPIPPATAWADAPPVVVNPRLRATGSPERRGQPARVIDRSKERAALAAQVAAEAEQTEAVRRRLFTDGPTRLSDLGELDRLAFAEFLRLLGDALSAVVDPARPVTVTTADGTLQITLEPPADGTVAEVHTPDGVLRGPDHRISIAPAGEQATRPVPAEVRA